MSIAPFVPDYVRTYDSSKMINLAAKNLRAVLTRNKVESSLIEAILLRIEESAKDKNPIVPMYPSNVFALQTFNEMTELKV